MDAPAVAKFTARIRMFDRVIASASLTLSNLPEITTTGTQQTRAIPSFAEMRAHYLVQGEAEADEMPTPTGKRIGTADVRSAC
jgi:hypothetical protein